MDCTYSEETVARDMKLRARARVICDRGEPRRVARRVARTGARARGRQKGGGFADGDELLLSRARRKRSVSLCVKVSLDERGRYRLWHERLDARARDLTGAPAVGGWGGRGWAGEEEKSE